MELINLLVVALDHILNQQASLLNLSLASVFNKAIISRSDTTSYIYEANT
jgi:hypothetical protein